MKAVELPDDTYAYAMADVTANTKLVELEAKVDYTNALLVAVIAVSSVQAEDGRMTSSKLNNLGLSSLDVASDAEGMEVRGQGRMFISGIHLAYAGPSAARNTYGATARGPNVLGFGQSQSIADWAVLTNQGFVLSFTGASIGRTLAFAP